MKYRWLRPIIFLFFLILLVSFSLIGSAEAGSLSQLPTGSVPTVTSSPRGPYVVVNSLTANDTQINVRAGPSALTEKVGVLLIGQEANAIGYLGIGCKSSIPA